MNDSTATFGAAELVIVLIVLGVAVLVYAAMWRLFRKAGRPGWAALIPLYNIYVQCKIVGRPGWWLILTLVPLVNAVILIILSVDTAKSFGKGGAFGFFGLTVFAVIGYPVLGFGSARYLGPRGVPAVPRVAEPV